jgi:hypothetical protein
LGSARARVQRPGRCPVRTRRRPLALITRCGIGRVVGSRRSGLGPPGEFAPRAVRHWRLEAGSCACWPSGRAARPDSRALRSSWSRLPRSGVLRIWQTSARDRVRVETGIGSMLRVTTLHTSSAAATAAYYADYLTAAPGEVPGRWSGEQARLLGLSGTVDVDSLQALLEGRDPVTGRRGPCPTERANDRSHSRARIHSCSAAA